MSCVWLRNNCLGGDYLFAFLGGQSGGLVDNLDSELSGSLNNKLAVPGVQVVGYNSGELLVVHKKHLKILGGLDDEGVQTILELEPCLLIRTITDLRHKLRASESPSYAVIDTTGLSPALLDSVEAVRLEAVETVSLLLHDALLVQTGCHV